VRGGIAPGPHATLRENTERPITAEVGSNRIVGVDPAAILAEVGSNRIVGVDPAAILVAYRDVMSGEAAESQIPEMWDGKAAQRIAEILSKTL